MRLAWAWSCMVMPALLGCPSDDVMSGGSSGSQSSEDGAAPSSSGVSATGMVPPGTSSDSGSSEGLDSSAGTTATEPTGTSSGGDIGDPDDGTMCESACGNGIICGTEQCDCGGDLCTPEGLGFAECAGLINPLVPDRVYTGGVLDCSPASCQFRFDQCTFCGDGVINGNEACEPEPPPQDTCASLGLGDATEPLPCDESCQIDTSSCV